MTTPDRRVKGMRWTAAALVGVFAAASCTSSQATPLPLSASPTHVDAVSAATVVAAPSPSPVAAPVQATVDLKHASIEVQPPVGDASVSWDVVDGALGVDATTAMRAFDGHLVTLESDREVSIAAVDPIDFRPFTPEATAQAPQVWERIAAGDILVRHDIAHELGIELGGTVMLMTENGSATVRVGAFASNGVPPVADIIVPWDLGAQLGEHEVTKLLVAVEEGASTSKVQKAIVAALGGGTANKREVPRDQQAQLFASNGAMQIPAFTYVDNGDGTISIQGSWVRDWIVGVDLPRLGRAYVNKIMAPQLLAAFKELEAKGLIDLLDPSQFGGGWVARHIDWNPRKSLSMHAWGLAIDINTQENALGATPTLDPRIVEVFDRWGFAWGGRWSRPDGMHFELAQVVTPG